MQPTFHRYVAIGDSATEGLEDPDPRGGYRGWADRLAMMLSERAYALGDPEPVCYANLGIRGHVSGEVRTLQFDQAMAMKPDLMTITAGVNDCLNLTVDFELLTDNLTTMLSESRGAGVTVMMFALPDPIAINPLIGKIMRERLLRLNEILRVECERYEALLLDLEQFPVAADPRLWFEDRLHGNAAGHERVARGIAWKLGLEGFDDWAAPLAEPATVAAREVDELAQWRDRVADDWDWAKRYFGPWLAKGIRGIRYGQGIQAKRPEMTPVEIAGATHEV